MVQIWFTGKQRFRMELFPVLPGQRHLRPLHSVYSSKSREWAVRHQRSEKRQRDRTAVFWMDPSGSYPRKDGSRPDSVWPSADGRFPFGSRRACLRPHCRNTGSPWNGDI